MCTREPEVPVIVSEKVPGVRLAPLTVRFAVAGKVFTEAGVMLQLAAPVVARQLNATVPLKPSSAAMEIAPVAPVPPALIS